MLDNPSRGWTHPLSGHTVNACNTVPASILKCFTSVSFATHSVFPPPSSPLLPRALAPLHNLRHRAPSIPSILAQCNSLPQCSGLIFCTLHTLYVMHICYTRTAVVFSISCSSFIVPHPAMQRCSTKFPLYLRFRHFRSSLALFGDILPLVLHRTWVGIAGGGNRSSKLQNRITWKVGSSGMMILIFLNILSALSCNH